MPVPVVVVATALSLATLVLTQESSQAEPVGPWRVISGDGRLITSDCLGSNATHECLADTVIACEIFSPAPQYSSDGVYREHPYCRSPGVQEILGVAPNVDPKLMTSYYSFDPWVLTESDLWYRGRDWRAGDLALDVDLFSCVPRVDCRDSMPADLLIQDVLAQCPPVLCNSSAFRDAETGRREPSITYIMRLEADGWRIVDMYKDLNAGRDAQLWNPAHWYRK